jgi:membrane protease YdiL (CAAX protease family)
MVLAIIFLYSFLIEKQSFYLERQKLFFLILSEKNTRLYLICAFGGAFLNLFIKIITHENTSDKIAQLSFIFKNNYPLIIFTCLTAGVVEELLMRGYIQPELKKFIKSIRRHCSFALLFGILHRRTER